MRKLIIVAAKSVLALISPACVGLLVFVGWLVWHYEYALGLPTKDRIAAVSSTAPACTTPPQRTYIPLSEIPPLLRKAALAYAQPDFYEAWSLNPFVELAAALVGRRKPGPASITRSVAKCLMSLAPEPYSGESLDRQVGTLVLMQRVASTLSRDRILEIYLNETYLGRGSYGVGDASISYFGRPLGLLRTDETAFVAALPRAPELLNRRQDIALDWRNHVIDRMLQTGAISDAEAASARARPLEFSDPPAATATEQRKL